jgi:hypothetical protein
MAFDFDNWWSKNGWEGSCGGEEGLANDAYRQGVEDAYGILEKTGSLSDKALDIKHIKVGLAIAKN